MRKRFILFIAVLLIGITLIGGCNGGQMSVAAVKNGDTVKVDYTGKLDDGSVFDSSQGKEPLEFTVGIGQVIPGFSDAVIGMKPGETKTVKIPADQAYGPYQPDMVFAVGKDQFPPSITPEVGQELGMTQENQRILVRVIAVGDKDVTLDANHPLAGKDLTFEITLREIVPAPTKG